MWTLSCGDLNVNEEGHRVTSGLTEVIVESHLSARRDTPQVMTMRESTVMNSLQSLPSNILEKPLRRAVLCS